MTIPRALSAVAAACLLALTACGGGSNDADSPSDTPTSEAADPGSDAGSGGGTEVRIADFSFDPGELEVKVGDTVTFTNTDSATHTATAKDDAPAAFDTEEIEGEATAEVTFDQAGDYEYFCEIHGAMTGTVRVME